MYSGHVVKRRTKSKGVVWRCIVEAGRDPATRKRRRITRQFASKHEAEKELRKVLTELEEGSYVEATEITVGEYLVEVWLPAHRRMVRPNTWASYELQVQAQLVPALGAHRLQKLTPAHISAFYGDLLEGRTAKGKKLSPKSVRNIHVILRKALADAVDWGYVTRNAADRVKVPKAPRANQHAAKYQTWSQSEVQQFLTMVSGDELYPLWVLAATTGMRRSELLGLRWRDIDFDGSRLSVVQTLVMVKGELVFGEPKTQRSARVVHLDTATVSVLRRHRTETLERRLQSGSPAGDHDLVFTIDGDPIQPPRVSRRFPQLAEQAGLPRIRLHDLRHTWATLALAAGIHPKIVSERLGHSSIAITLDTYSHVTGTLQAEAAEQVASLVFPVGGAVEPAEARQERHLGTRTPPQ